MITTADKVQVLVTQQGDAVCGEEGYGLKLQENIAAFWLDGWGETGRIYWSGYSDSAFFKNGGNVTFSRCDCSMM